MPENALEDEFDEDEEEDDEDDEDEENVKEATCECRCGECCRRLLIEVDLHDAERAPRIKELGSPTYTDERLTRSGNANSKDSCSTVTTTWPVCSWTGRKISARSMKRARSDAEFLIATVKVGSS